MAIPFLSNISGKSATFTGNLTAANLFLGSSSVRISPGGSGELGLNYDTGATGSLVWYAGTTSSKFSVTNAGNATFAGDVTINRSVDTSSPVITVSNDDSKHMKMGVVRSAAGTAPNTSFIAYDGNFRLIPGSGNSTEKFTLNSSGNATFAGDVTINGSHLVLAN